MPILEALSIVRERDGEYEIMLENRYLPPLRISRWVRTLMEQESPDATAVGTAMLALKQHQTKMKASHLAFEAKLKSMLTPEQKLKFEAFKAAREAGPRHDGPGGFAGHPMPPGGDEPPVPFQH